ncbi:hypothetical protein QE152_g31874 [Popillia japonica]|uniref:Uncharacterized protein n=1 Tax=Popillia japonica TaxID=7064 RepID=A0AAW1J1T4_POPJA
MTFDVQFNGRLAAIESKQQRKAASCRTGERTNDNFITAIFHSNKLESIIFSFIPVRRYPNSISSIRSLSTLYGIVVPESTTIIPIPLKPDPTYPTTRLDGSPNETN